MGEEKKEVVAEVKEEKKDEEKKTEDKSDKKVDEPKKPKAPKPAVHKTDFEEDTVYLYQFSRTHQVPSVSPYCLKVETWLRIAGLKYENVDHKLKYRSKKGQLPFVEVNGEEIADSTFIISKLSEKFDRDLDNFLTAEQRNVSHAMVSMVENHLLWVVLYFRTKNPSQFIKQSKMDIKHMMGTFLPNSVLNAIFKFRFKQGVRKVKAHGLGVHTPEEIEELGKKDLQVLSDLLGEKEYFFGEQPTLLDVIAFAILCQISCMDPEVPYPLREWMNENTKNLGGLIERIKAKFFSDWDDMCRELDLNSHLPKPPPKEEEEKKEEKKDDETDKAETEKTEKEEEKKDEEKKG